MAPKDPPSTADLYASISRLRAWLYTYGGDKTHVFTQDLKNVLHAAHQQAQHDTPKGTDDTHTETHTA